MEKNKAYLVLENGTVFEGKSFGYAPEEDSASDITILKDNPYDVLGEIVFTTAMTGYLETLTDPSYYGQIVIQTFPLIGNYGIIPADFESSHPQLKAYIVREWCQEPSNFRQEGLLDTFLKTNRIPGIYDIDTRALTKLVREYGVMNGKLVHQKPMVSEIIAEIKNYVVVDAVSSVTCKEQTMYNTPESKFKVVLWDFGAKENIKRELLKRNCDVVVVPSFTTAEEILKLNPDGLMLSNGPGDPQENTGVIKELQKLCLKKLPIFGICLGHQLLALAQGAKTEKLKYGHRGANQPAVDINTGRVYITSQNHGYAVINDSLPDYAQANFLNGNDNTCEGIKYENMPVFSVQFHPEASAGPLDTNFLFDQFIETMQGGKNNAVK